MSGIPTTAAMSTPLTDDVAGAFPMDDNPSVAATFTKKCYFCGDVFHNRRNCPARNSTCNSCGEKGHYAKVCRSKATSSTSASMFSPALCTITAGCPEILSQASVKVLVSGTALTALIDSGSSDSFISQAMAKKLGLKLNPSTQNISMALTSLKTRVLGHCITDITIDQFTYSSVRLGVLEDLCSDIILGQDFQRKHKRVIIEFGGVKPDLVIPKSPPICSLSAASIEEPLLFGNLLPDAKPIATKSRRFSKEDQEFIDQEVAKLLAQGIIEPSTSPWRAQVVVSKDPSNRHRKRLCVDYSQTINQYTELDAYPLPKIDEMINNLAQYNVFSTFDLKSAYHQVLIQESDRKFTGFEANGRLYQFSVSHLASQMEWQLFRERWISSLRKRSLMIHSHI